MSILLYNNLGENCFSIPSLFCFWDILVTSALCAHPFRYTCTFWERKERRGGMMYPLWFVFQLHNVKGRSHLNLTYLSLIPETVFSLHINQESIIIMDMISCKLESIWEYSELSCSQIDITEQLSSTYNKRLSDLKTFL